MDERNSLQTSDAAPARADEPTNVGDKDVAYWKDQVGRAKQELRKFHERGEKANQRFLDTRDVYEDHDRRMNVFWANVGILKAALYANPPSPMVTRQFKDQLDDTARVGAEIMERLLTVGVETPRSDMDAAFKYSVEDRLIPGMGQVWLRYVPTIEKRVVEAVPGEPSTRMEFEEVVDEKVVTEYVYWKDFLWGPSRVWEEVPWVGRRIEMTKRQATERFGKKKARKLEYREDRNVLAEDGDAPRIFAKKVAVVYELWDKEDRMVVFISDGCEEFLDRRRDPLVIRGFYPCPKPLMATNTTTNLTPRSDYYMVKDQYKELDKVNTRINYLVEACKVVGAYDKNNDGIQTMLSNAIENQLVPVDNWAMFAERGGIRGQVDWLPIEQVAAVLDRLRVARGDLVQQLYELTGISDIMRGVSAPRETATAQQLKAQYSSARLQYLQNEVAEFCQEAMRIKADIIAKHFRPKTMVMQSNMMFTYDAQLLGPAIEMLKNQWTSAWRLEIEADKLAIPDYNLERQSRIEYATAMGQMMGQAQQILQAVPELGPMVLETMKWVAAGFKNGRQMEGVLDQATQMIQQKLQQPRPDPETAKAQAEERRKAEESKASMARSGAETQSKIMLDRAKAASDIQINTEKARNQMALDLITEQEKLGNNPTANENTR